MNTQVGSANPNSSLSAAQIALLAGNYKLTPATLMAECTDWWKPAPWLQFLSAKIARAVIQGNQGLLISAPPRHGKSKLITVATPLWVLENFPNKNVIVATYGEELSTDFTREVKDIIKSNRTKLSVQIRRDVDRASNFVTPQGGGLKAVGLRGTITGRGADVLIIDDYIKEPKEALSHDYLESLKTWYKTVARTRLEPGATVIIVATRWVTNDLHGHIIRQEAQRKRKYYEIISIPALAKPGDILGRKPGEALFAERYTAEGLEDIREELGNRWFEAMFQQNPSAEESAITNPENLRYISKEDYQSFLERTANRRKRMKHIRSWDFASTKNAGDFTAAPIGLYDKDEDVLYIEGLIHGQYSAGRNESVFSSHADTDPEDVEYVIEQEPGASGAYATLHFKGLAPAGRKIRIVKAAASGSKLLKAQPFLAATERHKVVLVVDDTEDLSATPWVQKFIDEFAVFPEGGHDDIMDAISSLYNDATGRKFTAGSWGRSNAAKEKQEQLAAGDGVIQKSRTGGGTWGRTKSSTANMGNRQKAKVYRPTQREINTFGNGRY